VLHRQAVAIDRPFAEVRLALEVMFEGVEGAGHLPVRQLRRSSSPSGTDAEGAQGSPAQTQKEGPAAAAGAALDSSGQQQGQQAAAAAEEPQAVSVGGVVTVTHRPGDSARGYGPHVVLEWAGGSKGDVVADAVLAVLLQAAGEPSGAASAEAARAAALSRGDARAALAAEARLAAALLGAQFGPAAVDDATGRITLTLDDDGTVAHVDVVSGKVDCTEPVTRARLERALRRIGDALRPCALDFED
jgi:cleavage and polyadenylation specificity factor subunit 3